MSRSARSIPNVPRLRHLNQYWNWLPAFRAVAEVESVQRAAAELKITPSSLSRTIGLLERAVGTPLFDRRAGGLELNAAGDQLLVQARAAMRAVDDTVAAIAAGSHGSPFRLACPGWLVMASVADALVPSDAAASQQRWQLRATFPAESPEQAVDRGLCDAALVVRSAAPETTKRVDVHTAGALALGWYGRAGSARSLPPAMLDVEAHAWEGEITAAHGESRSPVSSDTVLGLLALARAGVVRALLPRVVADGAFGGDLRCLNSADAPVTVYLLARASTREREGVDPHVALLVRVLSQGLVAGVLGD